MQKQFLLENPKDTGDNRVTFIIRNNGTVLPGFISRAALIGIGGLTSNNLVSLFNTHLATITAAVRRKLPELSLTPYVSLGVEDVPQAEIAPPAGKDAAAATMESVRQAVKKTS